MRCLIFATLLLTGCASAQLVSTRFKPSKQGTVKLDWSGPIWRDTAYDAAKNVMNDFCAPLSPQIVGSDRTTQLQGAYANPMMPGAVNYDYADRPLIHFECVTRESKAAEREPASP